MHNYHNPHLDGRPNGLQCLWSFSQVYYFNGEPEHCVILLHINRCMQYVAPEYNKKYFFVRTKVLWLFPRNCLVSQHDIAGYFRALNLLVNMYTNIIHRKRREQWPLTIVFTLSAQNLQLIIQSTYRSVRLPRLWNLRGTYFFSNKQNIAIEHRFSFNILLSSVCGTLSF